MIFYGERIALTSKPWSATINMQDIGLSLSLPKYDPLHGPRYVLIHPCLTLPLHLPHGYKAASPAYLIHPLKSLDVALTVRVRLKHYLSADASRGDLKFLLASPTPVYDSHSFPMYEFREINSQMVRFDLADNMGEIDLQKFGLLLIAYTCISSSKKGKRVLIAICD